jgi:hypothetical protein
MDRTSKGSAPAEDQGDLNGSPWPLPDSVLNRNYRNDVTLTGRIESFEPVVLANHGGDLNGFVLLKGAPEKLDEIRREDTFLNFSIEASYCLENFGIVPGYVGDSIMDVFSRWSKHFSG